MASSRACGIRSRPDAASARADGNFLFDCGVGFDGAAAPEEVQRRFVGRPQHVVHGFEPNRCIGTRQSEVRDRRPQHSPQAIVRTDLGQLIRRSCACILQGQRIDEIEDGWIAFGRFDDDNFLIVFSQSKERSSRNAVRTTRILG